MPRIPPIDEADAAPPAHAILEKQRARFGNVTNMKRTLAHAPLALDIFMRWYDLRDEVAGFLGDRSTIAFTHAISSATECLICSTFFRRWLKDAGENPDALQLDEREQILVEFGKQLARNSNGVSDGLFARLRDFFTPAQLVTLTAFGGLMVATNIFNNALRVDLDEYLLPYRKGAGEGQ